MLNPENAEGNIEYKRFLINLDQNKLEHLATQMKWRLSEGNNEAIYYLGINDDGSEFKMSSSEIKETLNNFTKLVKMNDAEIINFEKKKTDKYLYFKRTIRKKNELLPAIRIVLLGNSQTGKTTFLSNSTVSSLHSLRSIGLV